MLNVFTTYQGKPRRYLNLKNEISGNSVQKGTPNTKLNLSATSLSLKSLLVLFRLELGRYDRQLALGLTLGEIVHVVVLWRNLQ